MQVYSIKAADKGCIIDVATVDSAQQAMIRYLEALDAYDRSWVSDQSGNDILIHELTRRAQEESARG